MKVGIFLTNQHPPGSDMIAELEGQQAMTRLARDRGWDAVATGQHYLSDGVRQLQLVPFLARLAAEAGEMTGIAGVFLAGLHNPVEVAECIASLDAIWRGNFVFGVGLGYREVEFDAFEVPRGQRVRRFEQCLEVVRRLWTEDKVSVENDVCTLRDVTATCRPVQQPHPPIWIAANSDDAVRRAARLGDTSVHQPACDDAAIIKRPDADLPRRTRRIPANRSRACCPICGDLLRQGQAHRAGDGRPIPRREVPDLCAWGQDQVLPGQESFRQSLDGLLRDRFVLGSPEECYEQLRPCWEEVGANFLIFRTHWSGMPVGHALSSMRLISDELLPALRRVATAG